MCLRDIPNKSFSQLYDEIAPQTAKLKQGKDEKFKKETGQFKFMPSL
jgi:hypothetical protein